MSKTNLMAVGALLFSTGVALAQATTGFTTKVPNPAYPKGQGPTVLIDEAHHNFHTAAGRYRPFADLVTNDGYTVVASQQNFSAASLKPGSILVIANALHASNTNSWSLPTPAAFTEEEISAVKDWVKAGGALLLIADHMPFPGAAESLAKEFGFEFNNGFIHGPGDGVFRLADDSLRKHFITRGRTPGESVNRVATFTGQAFRFSEEITPLMVFGQGHISLMPQTAWKFTKDTKRVSVAGWSHGGVRKFGKGRVAAFGEAAMFTAQVTGNPARPIGMNAPNAGQNKQFCLNIMHWLSRLLEPEGD